MGVATLRPLLRNAEAGVGGRGVEGLRMVTEGVFYELLERAHRSRKGLHSFNRRLGKTTMPEIRDVAAGRLRRLGHATDPLSDLRRRRSKRTWIEVPL